MRTVWIIAFVAVIAKKSAAVGPPADLCNPSPCLNGAPCTRLANVNFYCACAEPFTGRICETRILLACHSSPCENGGSCYAIGPTENDYNCLCQNGFTGRDCSFPVVSSPCDGKPCLNGGTCLVINSGDDYLCRCTERFSGFSCEKVNNVSEGVTDDCGQIVTIAGRARWPWQAAIYRVTDGVPALQCAGAVLQPGWILTAASCLRRRSEQRLVAAVGETILSGSLADDVPLFTISYDVTVFDYLALVSVSPHPFTPQRDVPKAVCLPDVDSSATLRSLPLTVTGWGATSRLSRRRVRAARVTLLPTAVCRSDTSTQVFIRRPPVVCTLSPRLMTVSQPCVATTGSPLLRLDASRRRYELVGLLTDATQQGCPQTGHVTYTSVGEYVDIIRLVIALGKQ